MIPAPVPTIGRGLLSALRPQDVFATNLRTSNGGPQALTPGIDMAGAGGLAWAKRRSTDSLHILSDTVRGVDNFLRTHATTAEASGSGFSAPTSTGISFSDTSGQSNVIWTFRRAPKFFDIVTYTGDGTSGRVIPHALGIKPGMIIVKRRSSSGDAWYTYHRSIGAGQSLFLNLTNAAANDPNSWNNTEPTAASFTVGFNQEVNAAGSTYVAYLFAHDPDTTNGIVQCGSYTAGPSATVNIGWQPQWLMVKSATGGSQWFIADAARGFASGSQKLLAAESSGAELSLSGSSGLGFTSTGFQDFNRMIGGSDTVIYLAIRAPI